MENREQQQPVPDEDEADAEMMEVEPQQAQQQLAANHQVEMETSVLSAILGRINVRMLLSNEERSRALAIRAAIAADATLENLSDMMYAQLALIDGDNLQDAVGRVRHLQQFREEYNIKDNFTQAQDISKRFLKAHRGHMLSISYNAMEGNYVAIYDQACLDTSSLRHDRDWELFLAYGWYLYHALSPDLHAIRCVSFKSAPLLLFRLQVDANTFFFVLRLFDILQTWHYSHCRMRRIGLESNRY